MAAKKSKAGRNDRRGTTDKRRRTRHQDASLPGGPVEPLQDLRKKVDHRLRSGTIGPHAMSEQDITERKQAEEAIKQNQKTFAELIERAPFGIYIVDSNFRIAQMNTGSQTGAFRNVRPVIGRDFTEAMRILWPESVAAEIIGRFHHTLETGEPYYSRDFIKPRHDADTVEAYEWELHRMTLPDGQYGVICYYFDSTKLREAETALRQSREDLDRAQSVGNIGSWRLDIRQNKLTWSDENHRIFGIPRGTPMTYETFLSTVHPDDRQYVDTKWKAGLAGEDYDIEHRIVVGAQTKWVREKAYLEFDDNGVLLGGFGITQDITERKHAAEQIEKLAKFPSENPFPVLRIASDGTILYANGPGLALLEQWDLQAGQKMPPDWCKRVALTLNIRRNIVREMKCGQRVMSLVLAPVVQGGYVNVYGRDITKERKAELALRRAHADLEKKVQQRTAELVQTVGLLREQAEQRMQAEKAAKAERQRFNDVLETLPAYVCLLTPDYYMPFANRVFREWFGYQPDKKCYEFLFNRTEPCETCETYKVLKTNEPLRWEWTGPNGRNYDIFDFPFKDTDGSQLILEMGIDITELKGAEKAVRSSEERYRSLTVATTQVVWTTDADGQVAGDLPSWRAFTGQDEQEIQGWGWIESLHPDDRERTAEIWSQAVRDRELYQTEYRLRRHDGQYRYVAVRGVPVIEPDGRIREWVGTCTDITEKKAAEVELDNYRMRLEELVKQRTEELARSNRDLEQFAYVASHDLQEPLRAIAGFVELLKRNLQSSLDAKTTEYMNFTVDGAVRMQSLISGLLEYSRVGTHGQRPEQTDSKAALEQAIANLRMSIKESGAEITTDDLPMVYFDGMQLSQLLQNLISNAIKFRAERTPRIHISAVRLDDSWRFAVADNGIGIDPQYAERVFLIFQRLHSREEYPGTGIGLSICKKIVERHNGKIWVESKPGDGSTFYFTVPTGQ